MEEEKTFALCAHVLFFFHGHLPALFSQQSVGSMDTGVRQTLVQVQSLSLRDCVDLASYLTSQPTLSSFDIKNTYLTGLSLNKIKYFRYCA